jgi:hypothetical protein
VKTPELVLVRVSSQRWQVIRLNGYDDTQFWLSGSIVYGPATKEECAAFVHRDPSSVEIAGGAA